MFDLIHQPFLSGFKLCLDLNINTEVSAVEWALCARQTEMKTAVPRSYWAFNSRTLASEHVLPEENSKCTSSVPGKLFLEELAPLKKHLLQ